MWDSASAYHPDASALVTRLYKELIFSDAVSSHIRGDDALDPKLREAALRLVQARGDDPFALNDDAWNVVKTPGGSADASVLARRRAERAAALAPWNVTVLRTLGFAHLRTGACREAIASMERRSALRNGPTASDFAVFAMARYRLGEHEAARDALEKLRTEMKKPASAKNEELQDLLREAEALVGDDAGKPAVASAGRK